MFNEKCELSPREGCLRGSWTSDPLFSWQSWAGTASRSLKFLLSCFSLWTLRGKSKPCVSDSFTVNSSSWCLARVLGCLRKGFWFGFIYYFVCVCVCGACFSVEIGSLFFFFCQEYKETLDLRLDHNTRLYFLGLQNHCRW